MRNPARKFWFAAVFIPALVLACVTINIYFPAEKVEAVASEIVDDIRSEPQGVKPAPPPAQKEPQSNLLQPFRWTGVAWADEITTVANPTIRGLKERMKNRYARMKPYYQKGVIVEGNDGYVSMGSTAGLNLKETRDLRNLVEAENSDRKALYAEVAKALKIDPSQIDRVAKIFAKEWQKPVR